ncbi:MAG: DUF1211 domain-containing protein [Actinobacteria bacterium]|nr:DUF1211 domain-containing protein [Actinomycetota bacterium]
MNDGLARERGLDVDRLVFFSDAVFAIAMTVLVLSVKAPAVPGSQLGHALHQLVPSIWSYFLTFAVIGTFWLAHHRMFHYVREIDARTLQLNLALLALIAILPFPTDVLGRYGSRPLGTMVYAAAVAAAGGALSVLWWHISHAAGLLRDDTPRSYIVHSQLRGASITVVFGLSIPIALWSPDVAKYVWIVAFGARLALVRRYGRLYPVVTR